MSIHHCCPYAIHSNVDKAVKCSIYRRWAFISDVSLLATERAWKVHFHGSSVTFQDTGKYFKSIQAFPKMTDYSNAKLIGVITSSLKGQITGQAQSICLRDASFKLQCQQLDLP